MSTWVRWSGNNLTYDGRVTPAPFAVWVDTPPGRAASARRAAGIRFVLLGRTRAARRQLWRLLKEVARDPQVVAEIGRECQAYLERLSTLAFGEGLPRVSVELHRLIVVPAVLVNAATYQSLARRLDREAAFRALAGEDELRDFFLLTLIAELESAVARAQPSPRRPLHAGRDWISVGINHRFVWRVPFEAPDWAGHHYLFELTRDPVTRTTRKLIDEKIRGFETSLESLSKAERADILRRAAAA